MDRIEAGWAIPLLLIGFVAVWLAFAAIAFCNGDLHPDALQTWSSGRHLAWGYAKHPPLAAWLAHAWMLLLPATDWSFRLLALTSAAVALWAVDLISSRFVRGDRRVVVLLLLMLLPIYQSGFERFNADAVLLLTWPIATYCFLRSYEDGGVRWAIAAGTAAALAVLGTYHSVFLILSFVVAAVLHPQRRAYFASQAPWISTATGLAVLGPHIYWLATAGVQFFNEQIVQRTENTSGPWLTDTLLTMLMVALALAIALLIWRLVGRRQFKWFFRRIGAVTPGLLLLALLAVGTIVFPAMAAIALRNDLTPFWALQSVFLLAILIVCGTRQSVARIRSVNLAALVMAIALASVVLLAPLHALYRNFNPLPEGRNYYQLAAAELTRQWHAQSHAPLPVMGGDEALALAVAFYSPDHPAVEAQLVRPEADNLPPEARFKQGWASLCFDGDALCAASMEKVAARTPRFVRSAFVIESSLFGLAGDKQRFTALLVPPGEAAPPAPATATPTAEGPVPDPARQEAPEPPAVVGSIPDVPRPASAAMASVGPGEVVEAAAAPSPPPTTPPVAVEDKVAPPPAASEQNLPIATDLSVAPPAASPSAASPPDQRADTALPSSEPPLPAGPSVGHGGGKPARHAAKPLFYKAPRLTAEHAVADYKVNWLRWAAAQRAAGGCGLHPAATDWSDPCCTSCWSTARHMAMRGRSASPCVARGGSQGCGSRALPGKPGRAATRKQASAICRAGAAPGPLLSRLAQPLCKLVAVLTPLPPRTARNPAIGRSSRVSEPAVDELEPLRRDQSATPPSAAFAAARTE